MELLPVFREAFALLRERPILFLPRLVMTGVWSLFWIKTVDVATGNIPPTDDLMLFTLFFIAMAPIQVWVYNMYVTVVKQQHENTPIDMTAAFKHGFRRLPHGIGAYLLISIVNGIALIPGGIIVLFGLQQMDLALLGVGGLVMAVTFFALSILFYFAPAAVVVGDDTFLKNIRNSLSLSQSARTDVFVLVIISFSLLLAANAARGTFATLGLAGFVVGRLVHSVLGLYLLVVNPEMLLEVMESTADT